MKIDRLKITNYRNLEDLEIEPNSGLNLIFGPNGSGKTNFCEAIHFVSTGDNIKGSRQRELINWDSNYALVRMGLLNVEEIVVYLEEGEGKEIKINSKSGRQSDLRSLVPTHTFVPEDLYISKGPPRRRRSLLNRHLSQLSSGYGHLLSDYNAELKKKNTLLKKDEINEEFLEVLSERLIELGARITGERADYLKKLNQYLPEIYGQFVQTDEKLNLSYTEDGLIDRSQEELEELLSDRLERNREKELDRGTSVVGPHRDKFEYLLDGRDLRTFGSQGELRTAVIATYLAYLELYEKKFNELPILVLDDILSELDRARGEAFLENLPEAPQIFMTTATRSPSFRKLSGEFTVLKIQDGVIERQ
ncbi:MAG: DNA replication and repair protein RecF [Candidatus Bipolaricaulota bacterium]|nr:DNA replication/repair protein RecF [Candidatus Bipolaricaulota bacterium]MBS3791299.1 DNA replication/repair protein RecF [Candidatus Bipolaricaulota bacterium]